MNYGRRQGSGIWEVGNKEIMRYEETKLKREEIVRILEDVVLVTHNT